MTDDLDILPVDNATDIYPLLPESIQRAVNNIPQELLGITEAELSEFYEPSRNDRYIRVALWNEFVRAKSNDTFINAPRVYGQVMNASTFCERFLANPHRVAFMMIPPVGYKLQMQNLLDMSLGKLYDILSTPLTEKNMSVILKAALSIRDIQKGPAVQRNININADMSTPVDKLTPEEIDKKILELKKKLDKQNPDNTIEVKSSDE